MNIDFKELTRVKGRKCKNCGKKTLSHPLKALKWGIRKKEPLQFICRSCNKLYGVFE
jgi:hypothetical protein